MGSFAHLLGQEGLGVAVHTAALRRALADLDGFIQVLGEESLVLNIRPSVKTLSAYVSDAGVERILETLGDSASRIVMTITPALPLDKGLLTAMHRLRDAGMQMELREFALGHPSLAHVARLPLSGVRLTRELYASGGNAEVQARIVAATVSAASTLGLYCSADGVDSEAQLNLLASAGCRFASGAHFGEPLDSETMLASLLSPGLQPHGRAGHWG